MSGIKSTITVYSPKNFASVAIGMMFALTPSFMSCNACFPSCCLHAKQIHRPFTLSTNRARLHLTHLAMDNFMFIKYHTVLKSYIYFPRFFNYEKTVLQTKFFTKILFSTKFFRKFHRFLADFHCESFVHKKFPSILQKCDKS